MFWELYECNHSQVFLSHYNSPLICYRKYTSFLPIYLHIGICSGAGEGSLAGGVSVCLYSLNFTKQGRVSRMAGQELHCDAGWQPQGVSWGVDRMNLKRKERISSLACACPSLASVRPVSDPTLLLYTFLLARFWKNMVSSALRHNVATVN